MQFGRRGSRGGDGARRGAADGGSGSGGRAGTASRIHHPAGDAALHDQIALGLRDDRPAGCCGGAHDALPLRWAEFRASAARVRSA